MKRLLFYFLLVFIGIFLIDLTYRYLCVETFENPVEESGVRNKIFFVNEPYDIAILGASRAECHYRAKIIEDSLKWSAYNFGGSGGSILQQYLALIKALKNGSLKIVVLDITPSQLSNKWIKERLSAFYPYYWVNDTVRLIVNQIDGRRMNLLMRSSLIQYNSNLTSVITHFLNFNNNAYDEKGFTPLDFTGKKLVVNDKDIEHEKISSNGGYNPYAIYYFHKLISLCKDNGVKVVVCLSPSLVLGDSERLYIEKLAADNNVECWDYSDSISDRELFRDASHLNAKGADLFTNMIVDRLRVICNN